MASTQQSKEQSKDTRAVRQDSDTQGKTQGDELQEAVDLASGTTKAGPASGQANPTTQSDVSLSQSDEDDGRFSVAEEQNFDQQSDQARRVGQMPEGAAGVDPSEAMARSVKPDKPGTQASPGRGT
jgi:hypothetical protein